MIAAENVLLQFALAVACTAEFAAPDDQGVLEHVPLFEILISAVQA